MRTAGLALVICAMLAPAARAEDKPAKTTIVGTWEFVKADEKDKAPPPGTTFEFTKDGKLKVSIKLPGQDKPLAIEGSYKVDGKKLTTTMKGPDGKEKSESITIKSLTATKLVLEKDGKAIECKRKS